MSRKQDSAKAVVRLIARVGKHFAGIESAPAIEIVLAREIRSRHGSHAPLSTAGREQRGRPWDAAKAFDHSAGRGDLPAELSTFYQHGAQPAG
jgi:hypothetical protein